MRFWLALAVLFLARVGLLASPSGDRSSERPVLDRVFVLCDTQGRRHTAAEWKGKKAVVLFFLGTECPVSNGYAPEMARLARTFAHRDVVCYGIHPDPDVTAQEAARHARTYQLPFPVLLDPTQAVAGAAGVQVVPETAVLSPQGHLLYRGRIDDRYTLDGKRRDQPRTRDLEETLRAVLAGKPPPRAQMAAFGCALPAPARPR